MVSKSVRVNVELGSGAHALPPASWRPYPLISVLLLLSTIQRVGRPPPSIFDSARASHLLRVLCAGICRDASLL